METGAVKFGYESSGREVAPFVGFDELNATREELRRLGLLGVDGNGIGFGNVSLRDGATDTFFITGSGTGGLPSLALADYAKVVGWDFEGNWLRGEGRAVASAESLTHAAIYAMDAEVRAVMHGHDSTLWRNLLKRGMATRREVLYGTPAMAREVQRLFRETDVRAAKVFAMAGHEDGIVAFGRNFAEALAALEAVQSLHDV